MRREAERKLNERRGKAEPVSEQSNNPVYCRMHDWLTGGKLVVYPQYTISLMSTKDQFPNLRKLHPFYETISVEFLNEIDVDSCFYHTH